MITVSFLSGLKEIVGQDEVQLTWSGKLSDLLDHLCHRYGERLCRLLFGEEPVRQRNSFVKVIIDGEDIKDDDPLLRGNETVVVFLPIAGG